MPRIARLAPGGVVYHVLNRGNGRRMIFHKDADARAFVDLLAETKARVPMRVRATASWATIGTRCCGPTPTATSPRSSGG